VTDASSAAILGFGEIAAGRPCVAEGPVAILADEAGTDVALVRLAQRGDTGAFDRLAAARLDHAYRLAVSILCSEPDARDAVQETFVAAWRELPRLRDPASLDPWLDRILVNRCRMALRHRKVVSLREIQPGFDGGSPADHGSAAPDEIVEDVDLVRRAMRRLDAGKRAILVLHHVEDRPLAEIATILGIPVGTAKWRLHQARADLERALGEESR
jgi:RNA polymerase sigma-70 factor (ECF subfamily)